jgi:hypothetical protein
MEEASQQEQIVHGDQFTMWVGDQNNGVTMPETRIRGTQWSVPAPWKTIKCSDP